MPHIIVVRDVWVMLPQVLLYLRMAVADENADGQVVLLQVCQRPDQTLLLAVGGASHLVGLQKPNWWCHQHCKCNPNQKKHRAAHSAAHGQPMGSRVGCPWAAHAHGQFAMQMSSLPTVLYISWELPMGCPWAAHGQAKLICMFH